METKMDRDYFLRGVEQYEKGNNESAMNYMADIVEWNPGNAEAWYYIGLIYYEWSNNQEELFAYKQKALNALSLAIAVSPNADAYCIRGNVFYTLENYQRAIEDYTQAIAVYAAEKQNFAAFIFNRANANRALGNQREAVADYLKAKALQPLKYTKAYYEYLDEVGIDPDDD